MTRESDALAPSLTWLYDASLNLQRVVERRTHDALARWDHERNGIADDAALRREQQTVRAAVDAGARIVEILGPRLEWDHR
jgi:hypothetical protein